MANRNKKNGTAFEHRCKKHLEDFGYFVIRSAGSHSAVDLLAVREGKIFFVQCKRNGVFHPAEWNEFLELANKYGATPILAEMPGKRGIRFMKLNFPKSNKHIHKCNLAEEIVICE